MSYRTLLIYPTGPKNKIAKISVQAQLTVTLHRRMSVYFPLSPYYEKGKEVGSLPMEASRLYNRCRTQ